MIRQLQGNRRGGYGLVVLRIVWSSAWTRRSTRTFRSGEDQELDFLAGMWEMPRISRRRNKKRNEKDGAYGSGASMHTCLWTEADRHSSTGLVLFFSRGGRGSSNAKKENK